jgi:integrase/recombinase XerD
MATKLYPLGKDKIQIKFPESLKVGLDEEEVRAIEALKLPVGSTIWHTRNVWLTLLECVYQTPLL